MNITHQCRKVGNFVRRHSRSIATAASLAAVNVARATGTVDTDVTAVSDNMTATFGSVKTAGIAIASSVVLISLGFWALKKFYRKG